MLRRWKSVFASGINISRPGKTVHPEALKPPLQSKPCFKFLIWHHQAVQSFIKLAMIALINITPLWAISNSNDECERMARNQCLPGRWVCLRDKCSSAKITKFFIEQHGCVLSVPRLRWRVCVDVQEWVSTGSMNMSAKRSLILEITSFSFTKENG
jgi:hypothetical protein